MFSYAVRKWRSVCSVCGREASVMPKGWPLSLRADSGHAAVGYPAAAASVDNAASPGAMMISREREAKRKSRPSGPPAV